MKARDRANNFPLLRLVAAISVILADAFLLAGGHQNMAQPPEGAGWLGQFGVSIFFVIGGYLVTQSYETTRSTPRFLLKRFLRVYPALLACLLFCALAIGAAVTVLPLGDYYRQESVAKFIVMNLLMQVQVDTLPTVIFTANESGGIVDGPLWTVPYGFASYATVALLGRFGWLRMRVIAGLWLVGIAAALYDTTLWQNFIGGFLPLLGCFAAGMAMFKLRGDWLRDRRLALLSAVGLLIAAGMDVSAALFAIFGAYLVIHLALDPRLPRVNAAKYGDLSYGLYLYGWPVQQTILWLCGDALPWWALFAIALPVTAALAFISWQIIERPALSLKPRPVLRRRSAVKPS